MKVDEWGNPLPVSVPCLITPKGDTPVIVKGQIPYFTSYRNAYDFLAEKRIAGVVYEGELSLAEEYFQHELTPAKDVL
jgi:hypothetical protein